MSGAAARATAARIGARVEQGAHLPQAVEAELGRSHLEGADRGFATELAYGAERWRLRLDHALRPWLRRPLQNLDPVVRALLRQGAYQLLRLEMPGYAVVHASVDAAAQCRAAAAGGLVNAVLRRIAESGEPPLPLDRVERLAVAYAHPRWLVRRWLDRLGEEETISVLTRNQEVPPIVLRANRLRISGSELCTRLRDGDREAGQVEGLPQAVWLRGAGDVRRLPGWEEGLFQVQDVGAQAVGESIPTGGDFLEAACGLGTKTLHQAERRTGRALGIDLDERRIALAKREGQRLGLPAQFAAGDARRARELAGAADEVLLDAPCSALAVVARRPDAKWRRQPEDLRRNGELQLELLRAAYAAVRPGGALTYSVCSLEPEETTEPVGRLLLETGARVDECPVPFAEGEAPGPGYRLPGMYMVRILQRPATGNRRGLAKLTG